MLADEAARSVSAFPTLGNQDQHSLIDAHAYCKRLTADHSKSFYLSSSLLPEAKREAARALYAFCRVTDDIVDQPNLSPNNRPLGDERFRSEIIRQMENWKGRALTLTAPTTDPVSLAWADARAKFKIPHRFAEQLIDGVLQDLDKKRYNDFEELAAYSYGVASTVGLMTMHIVGYQGQEAISFAIKLGVALQLTNILRDVGEDLRNDRIYLPLEELDYFNLNEDDLRRYLENNRVDRRWAEFMSFQINRNRRLYAEAMPGIARLNREGRFAIRAASELYMGILEDIERHEYNVFNRRSHLTKMGKLSRLPGIWMRSRRGY